MTIEWTAPLPWTLLLVLLWMATGPWVRRHLRFTVPDPGTGVRRRLLWLRLASLLMLLIAAAGPLLVLERDRTERPVVEIVLEDSASMDLPGRLGTRWDDARALVAAADSVLAPRGFDLRTRRGSGLGPLRDMDDAPPGAVGSSLTGLLRGAAADARLTVLVSDGHGTAPDAGGRPVVGDLVVAGVGDPVGPADVGVGDVGVPDEAQVGDEVVVEAVLTIRSGSAGAPDSLIVVLEADGREVDRRILRPAPGDVVARCELRDRPVEPGLRVYRVLVESGTDERLPDNNEAGAAVVVRDGRRDVLVLASRPGWIVRFLSAVGSREDRLGLRVVAPTAAGPAFTDDGTAWSAPADPQEWSPWRAVVLADPGAAAWAGEGLAGALAGGTGLVCVADDSPTPWLPGVRKLLPVTGRLRSLARGDWMIDPTDAGADHPVLEGLGAGDDPFRHLPPLGAVAPADLRGGSVTLLDAAAGAGAAESRPLLAVTAGEGPRVGWIGSDGLWQQVFWRAGPDDGDQRPAVERLLGNLLLWAVRGDDGAGVTLLGQRRLYHAGERFEMRARSLDVRGRPGPPPGRLVVRSLDDEASETLGLSLRPDPTEPGTSSALIGPLAPGRYSISAASEGDGTAGSREIVVLPTSPELRQGTQDIRRLRALAAAHDGLYVQASSEAGLQAFLRRLDGLDPSPATVTSRTSLAPWAGWPFLLLVVGCLSAEWILRRRHGLL